MFKRTKLLSLGLAMTLFMTQTAWADVTISPLGASQPAGQESRVQTQNQGQTQTGMNAGAQSQGQGQSQTGMGAGAQSQNQGQSQMGMGAGAQSQNQIQSGTGNGAAPGMLTPSASYSTKEPVSLNMSGVQKGNATKQGPDVSSQNTGGQADLAIGANNGPGGTGKTTQGTAAGTAPGGTAGTAAGGASGGTAGAAMATDVILQTPEISAQAAVVYDVTHGKILYEKEADIRLYPASTTKLMTALLVLEKADLNSTVTFSKTAVTNLESGAVTLKLTEGDRVSVKDCLYGLLLKSANEVANGLAEHVGGSISGFADMMNQRAKELGCTGTNFVNPSGLNDPNHYTTCRDMAKIAAAAFANETLCKIGGTLSYEFPATKNAPARTITPGHKMLYPSDSRYYGGIVGGKTGYTSLAGNTLVTCVEKNGVRIIAVVMKAKSTQYTDTKALLDYGFEKAAADTTGAAVGNSGSLQAGTGNVSYHKWIQDGANWRFELADGSRLSNCLVTIDGAEYAFNTEGIMLTGWQRSGDTWYCFEENGSMVKNGWKMDGDKWFYLGENGVIVKNEWRQDSGKWFYLGPDGAMLRNTWIDNTYYVGADGIWVQQ